eukprot:CAMPEP_0182542712 /NCGR_PEP_ID=MMETSP1323-20130603/30567_1 /TAXON_ID=236787 /ORGANISM="Florenciella parvula, Strain RCC1693" /LENGTH=214 /DNA_ID=CAMNT_0024753585 /DNA_START=18 /DNA_END=662 /DNA_ORIENTATION=-
MSPWLLTRYLVTGLYVGVATIGVMLWWFYDNGVNPFQLCKWTSCPDWEGFMPGGVDIAADPSLFDSGDVCSIFMGKAKAKAQTLSLSVLVCMEMLKALSAVSVNSSLFTVPPWKNPYLLAGVAAPFALHLMVVQVPSFAQVFSLTTLTKRDWKKVLACSLPILLLEEILKAIGRNVERHADAKSIAAHQAPAEEAAVAPVVEARATEEAASTDE